MGYFRRYKKSNYSPGFCRDELARLQDAIVAHSRGQFTDSKDEAALVELLEEWASFRELLARHEGHNKTATDDSGASG